MERGRRRLRDEVTDAHPGGKGDEAHGFFSFPQSKGKLN